MNVKKMVDELMFKAIHLLMLLVGKVSEPVAYAVSKRIGEFWFRVDRDHRKTTLENLRFAYQHEKSEEEIKQLAREVFVNIIVLIFELGRSLHWKPKDLSKKFRYYGLSHLINAQKKGKGILVLTGHLGNWELLPQVALATGIKASAVYKPLDFKPLDRFILGMRQRYGSKMYPLRKAKEGILHELGQGHMVGLLIDHNAKRKKGVFVDFFGRKASADKGLAQLALTTGAPVVPLFALRENGHFRVEFGAEVTLVQTGDSRRDILENTARFNKVVEDFVRRYPEQWFWIHKRWKYRPLDKSGNPGV